MDPEAGRRGRLGRPVGGHEHRPETPLAAAFRRGRSGGLLLQPLAPEGAAEPAGGTRAHHLAADGVAYEDDGERGVRGAGQWAEVSFYREVTTRIIDRASHVPGTSSPRLLAPLLSLAIRMPAIAQTLSVRNPVPAFHLFRPCRCQLPASYATGASPPVQVYEAVCRTSAA